ncbi:MAG: hypothetical protein JST53_16815 [Actinobacteria bacterium]|nr:hypothetical protein [Actinomycetota bacterium]
MWRWLVADPRDVVDLAGARELGEPARGPSLPEELRRWRRIVARRRLVVLARRHAAAALVLAALLEIAAQLDAVPQWAVVAVPLVLFVVSMAALSSRGPSPFGLARMLDDKLGLNDRLATALEIEARGGDSVLERRTVADAAGLLAAGREDWHASAAPAGREWWALVGPAAAIGVAIAIGALSAGNSSSQARLEALGIRLGGRGGDGAMENEYVKHAEKHSKTIAPTGKLHKFQSKEGAPPSAEKSANSEYQKIPQAERTGQQHGKAKAGEGGDAGNRPQSGDKLKRGANSEAKGGEEAGGDKSAPGLPKEKENPTLGFNVKSTGGNGEHARRGTSKVRGAAGKKAVPNGAGDQTTAGGESESNNPGGTPSGGANHAGGEQGTNQKSQAKPITGQASQAVRIQPAYAPSRSKEAEREERKAGREEGAGGKARTGQVTGATQVGERFSFVPVTGGAVPGPGAGLQLNYLESLKWVERLPWG